MRDRHRTRRITVGDERTGVVPIGGDAPIAVQTMTAGPTHDVEACIAEITRLAAAGADLVRVAVPQRKDTAVLGEILQRTSVPIVADVHFHHERALEAIEAGVHKIRLNPGNINEPAQVHSVIDACRDRGIPIRVGVNEGSVVDRREGRTRQRELGRVFSAHRHGHLMALMIAKLEESIALFEARGFDELCLSAKSMDAMLVIDVYREIAGRFDHPLHVGVTHAGPRETGLVRSIVAPGALLLEGIGDTIRLSYTGDPVQEVEDALELLYCLGLRERHGAELIACPSCGRIQVDLFSLIQDVRRTLAESVDLPIKVAVMGCVVNGPGEAEGADVAVFAGDRRGIIYVQGERVANVPEAEILDRLRDECLAFQERVRRGEATLGEKRVRIIPPEDVPLTEGDRTVPMHLSAVEEVAPK